MTTLNRIKDLIGDKADEWLDCPNDKFSGRTPGELIGTEDEPLLVEMLDQMDELAYM